MISIIICIFTAENICPTHRKSKNMKKLLGVVIILAVAILMTLTVPDKKAHKEAMMNAVKEYVDEEAEERGIADNGITRFGKNVVNKAIELAWPYGTPKEVYKYEGGSPTEEFKSALDAAYPDRSGWGKKPKAGASCDVFVGTVVRTAGFDESFPRGLDDVEAHIDKYPDLWEKHSYDDPSGFELLPGDVIFQKWSTNGRSYGHIMIYIGDGKVANAHYGGGGKYGIIQLLSKQVRNDTEIRTVKKSYVFRPVR